MAVNMDDINLLESESFITESKSELFTESKKHEIGFTYSDGKKSGNYTATCNVFQMGRTMPGNKFTSTVLLTCHDFGLNHFSNYATLMQSEEMRPILQNFTVFHIDFPCMSSPDLIDARSPTTSSFNNSKNPSGTWDQNLAYPSLEELSRSAIPAVLDHFSISSLVFLTTGAGSNVALRYALRNPNCVMGFIALNPIYSQVGWGEWLSAKVNITQPATEENILNYLFNPYRLADTTDNLVGGVQDSLKFMDKNALAGFEQALISRSAINLFRPTPGLEHLEKNNPQILRVPTCIIIGDELVNFRYEDAMELNSLLDVRTSNFVKLQDAGCMCYSEQPTKVGEAIRLFLQGIGYIASVQSTRLTKSRSNSMVSPNKENNSFVCNTDFTSGDGLPTPSKINVSDRQRLVT